MSYRDALLALALDDYAPGAAFTTALVNTVEEPRARDALMDVEDLRTLLGRYGDDWAAPELSEDDVRELREVRTRLLRVFDAPDERHAVAALNALLGTPCSHVVCLIDSVSGSGWMWSAALGHGASLAERAQVVSSISLLAVVKALGSDRFRTCAAPDCSGLFVDTTRAGRRKYCQPSICGNRQNVAAYRARRARQPASR
jgi:predicted RNA-binding Zn ribbon-like protein